jgi:formate C-acetyltransferase
MSDTDRSQFEIWQPSDQMSERIKHLRDYYFLGNSREWNNEVACFSTGTTWDVTWNPRNYFIVPDVYFFMRGFMHACTETATRLPLPDGFWDLSIPERKAAFLRAVMVDYLSKEQNILEGELLAGGKFNTALSKCLNAAEGKEHAKNLNRDFARSFWINDRGIGNAGATGGHLIPDYPRVLKIGFKGICEELQKFHDALPPNNKKKKAQLRAMMVCAQMVKEIGENYAREAEQRAEQGPDLQRKEELLQIAQNCRKVPWEPAETFWDALQSLWVTHILVMADESYPGPGVSFGRVDQYLWPYYKKDVIDEGTITREFAKELWSNFSIKCNYAYDYQIRVGSKQGITAGFGQLYTLSGGGPDGEDLSNDLTFLMLEVIEDLNMLEPKPNVRLHKNTPEEVLNKVVSMVSKAQGAPFLLNFDERAMGALVKMDLPKDRIWDYAPVGCLENTLQGDDRSGTVDVNLNLVKAVELVLFNGMDLFTGTPNKAGKPRPMQIGAKTGDPTSFATFDQFWGAFTKQMQHIVKLIIAHYDNTDTERAKFEPTPYLSCIVGGCAENGLDVTEGGARHNFVTVEGVTFATCVDSILAIKKMVFEDKKIDMATLVSAIKANWQGYEKEKALMANKAPKYGNDDPYADEMACKVMKLWVDEVTKYQTPYTHRQYRAGMLSWNYWIAYADTIAATPDGRAKGQFLSNAICPVNGADRNGPTSVAKSVGNAMDNLLPNGASHTITFNPSLLRDPEHKEKFKAFLRAYDEVGGSALQINMLDADMLREAQKHPQEYRNLLVRVTGYNAYFTSIGRELQDEIIARESHHM